MSATHPLTRPRFVELLIDGKWRPARSERTFTDWNPATGEALAEIAAAQADDVEDAVAAAVRTQRTSGWSQLNPSRRGHILYELARRIRDHADELAELEAQDVGKLLADARAEVELSADLFEYYAGAANKVLGEVYGAGPGKLAYLLAEPVGVVAGIVPWNYPLPLAALKVAPALAMGNAMVLKPAEEAPLSALLLGQLALEAGVPEGILNVVPGLGEVAGQALIEHPDVALIAFTGSTEVGRKIMHAAADRIARVELELGGKSPHLVFSDASLEDVVPNVALGLFKNAGQDCCAGSRILVHERVYPEVVERLQVVAESQKVGNPFEPGTTMGPLISLRQRQRVHGYTQSAVAEGASLVTGGAELVDGYPEGASYYAPTLFANVGSGMRIFNEEVFGPVGAIVTFKDEEEAIRLANATSYGLAAAIWTRDLGTAHRVAARVEAGMVWVNEFYAHVMEMPFGGYKQSGIGKDYSMHALRSYYQLKEVAIRYGG